MKKTYSKPRIMFEDFTLSTNIAAGCEGIVGNPSKDACVVQGTGGINIFDDSISLCDFTPGGIGDTYWDQFCYNIPTEERNLFNS